MTELRKQSSDNNVAELQRNVLIGSPTPIIKQMGLASSAAVTSKTVAAPSAKFPYNLPHKLPLITSQHGIAYAVMCEEGNSSVLRIGSKQLNNIIRAIAHVEGVSLRNSEIKEINEYLIAHAEMSGIVKNVWSRVAPIEGGY